MSRPEVSVPEVTMIDPYTEFHLFPDIPVELRLKIWSLVPRKPCIVIYEPNERPKTTCQFPAVLHVCRESRNEYLRSDYECMNLTHPIYTLLPFDYPACFSFEIDNLHIPLPCGIEVSILDELRHVSVELKVPDIATFRALRSNSTLSTEGANLSLAIFPKLEVLTILVSGGLTVTSFPRTECGKVDIERLPEPDKILLSNFRDTIVKTFPASIQEHPHIKMPLIEFRPMDELAASMEWTRSVGR